MTTVAQVLEQIRAWAAKSKPGDWIIGSSWHPLSQLQERRYLTRWEIDQAAPDNPVFLPVGHFAMTNSMALARAGINKATAHTNRPHRLNNLQTKIPKQERLARDNGAIYDPTYHPSRG